MANKTSQHILSTSANLLGVCLFVITALHFTNRTEISYIDELTAIASLLLATSAILSFLSIKTTRTKLEKRLELIADYLFIFALTGIMVVIFLITLNFI